MAAPIFRREWGEGRPVIAMHPLGLDSSGFEGFGRALARRGMRTVAVDLPGFGRKPAPDGPLRPDVLAAPVIELARELGEPPVVLGISLGGRVALEAALAAPEQFRAVIAIAPGLPWRRFRMFHEAVRLLDPAVAAWLPLERAWPLLRWISQTLETVPWLRDDEIAQAAMRFVYYLSCPATRTSFLSAARELALDPPDGPQGFWTRLPELVVPAAFVWGERDRLISPGFAHHVARSCPEAHQVILPCLGHWLNGPHHRCLAEAIAPFVDDLAAGAAEAALTAEGPRRLGEARLAALPCLVGGTPAAGRLAPVIAEGGELGS